MVHKDKVVEIYNSQNEKQVKLNQVEAFLLDLSEELDDAFIMIHKDYFVHEAIMLYDDENYFEETKQYNALVSYMNK